MQHLGNGKYIHPDPDAHLPKPPELPPPPGPGYQAPAFNPNPGPEGLDYGPHFDTRATSGHNKWYKPSVDTWQRPGPGPAEPHQGLTGSSRYPSQPDRNATFDSMGLVPGKNGTLANPHGYVPPGPPPSGGHPLVGGSGIHDPISEVPRPPGRNRAPNEVEPNRP